MFRKLFVLISIAAVFMLSGCIKETYDLDHLLLKQAHFSPTFAVSAVYGDITFDDLAKKADDTSTIVYENDKFVKLIYKIMTDYYDLNDMVSFSETYKIGNVTISPFSGSVTCSLNEISKNFSPADRATFVALDGTTDFFPSFPVTDFGDTIYANFTNFESALFLTGSIVIKITDNLPASIYSVNVTLYNTVGHVTLGNGTVSSLSAGETDSTSIDIAGLQVKKSITAKIVINGSPGTSTQVPINLATQNIKVSIRGRDLIVISGRIIVPPQSLPTLDNDNTDTIPFDPGEDVEITLMKMITGNLAYTVHSGSPLTSDVSFTLPTAKRNNVPVTGSFTVNPNSTLNGNIALDNSTIDMGTISSQPFNLLPIDYNVIISSKGNLIDFIGTDEIKFDLETPDPNFDYVKGYFGKQSLIMDPDTIDLEIKDILDKITGSFLISSPSINLNYSNSFAVPIEAYMYAVGYKSSETVNLNLDPNPFSLSYPVAPAVRDLVSVYSIDKNNSLLPSLVSLPPEKIIITDSLKMNPAGNTGARDNYIFGDSRFLLNLEVVVPLEFRLNNLQFADTTDNFMQKKDSTDNGLNPDDFEFLRIDITAENGFPLGISLSMVLLDSLTNEHVFTIDAPDVMEPASVDNNGKVIEPKAYTTSIEIPREFWEVVNDADKIIFIFTANTTDNGTKDVKIYSDYKINFRAVIVLKPDIKFNLK
jgi:hypothetical protein